MAEQLRKRSEIDAKYKWNLSHIFADDTAWEQAWNQAMADIQKVAAYDGKVAEDPKGAIKAFFEYMRPATSARLYGICDVHSLK